MARRSEKPAVRYRDLVDPDVPVDANDERCPDCGANYEAFRSGTDFATVAGELNARGRSMDAPGVTAMVRDADRREHVGKAAIVGHLAMIKRGAWEAAHGPGRCVADESSFTGRVSLAGVILGWPDTAAIMAGIPEPITDDESRTIWCALPVGPAPNPPSLASIMLECIDGADGAADAFDELDHLRSAGGIPSAWE